MFSFLAATYPFWSVLSYEPYKSSQWPFAYHSKQLTELEKDIENFCKVQMTAQTKRDTSQLKRKTSQILGKIKQILEDAVSKILQDRSQISQILEETSQISQMIVEEFKAKRSALQPILP